MDLQLRRQGLLLHREAILPRIIRIIACLVLFSSPALADSMGSAVGGTAGNQSNMAGGIYKASPTVLIDGQQAGFAIDPTTHGLVTVPASGGPAQPTTQAALTAVAGTQRGLSIATATSLTVPATATVAVISAEGVNNSSGICLYWQDDGTAPTASAGQPMSALAVMVYKVTSLPIQLIAATSATCKANISYYR